MSLPLTAEQIAQLPPLVTAENYPAAYELLNVWTADSEDSDVELFRTWLLGAADVNQGLGPFAALIGAYNMRQGELRGWPITADRDLLVGGLGTDTLRGGGHHDFLIGGNSYFDEVNNLFYVFDDGVQDRLEGGGDDIYWAGDGDIINDAEVFTAHL